MGAILPQYSTSRVELVAAKKCDVRWRCFKLEYKVHDRYCHCIELQSCKYVRSKMNVRTSDSISRDLSLNQNESNQNDRLKTLTTKNGKEHIQIFKA